MYPCRRRDDSAKRVLSQDPRDSVRLQPKTIATEDTEDRQSASAFDVSRSFPSCSISCQEIKVAQISHAASSTMSVRWRDVARPIECWSLLVVMLLAFAVGCGKSSSLERAIVSGKVNYQGKPVNHGLRTSNLFSCQDFGEEVGIPAGDLHLAAQAFLHRVMLQSRDGETSQPT